jgi:hypothetical protein
MINSALTCEKYKKKLNHTRELLKRHKFGATVQLFSPRESVVEPKTKKK